MGNFTATVTLAGIALAIIIAGAFGTVAAWSKLRVMNAESVGRAEFVRAEQNRQIKVKTAEAERDAAKLQAEAIEIMGKAAQQYPEYRKQEFISAFGEALREGTIQQIIYVPTEANIPVLEAGQRH